MSQSAKSAVEVPESLPHAETGGARSTSFSRTGSRVLGGLLAYLLLATVVIGWERSLLFDAVGQIEAVHVQDEQQIALNFAVSHAVLAVNEQYFAKDIPGAAKVITLDLDHFRNRGSDGGL